MVAVMDPESSDVIVARLDGKGRGSRATVLEPLVTGASRERPRAKSAPLET
jgi:hypothetical protein